MGRNRKKSAHIQTELARVIDIFRKGCNITVEKVFAEKLAQFFLRLVKDLSEINPSLTNRVHTETQENFLKIILLKTVLDLDILRSLNLFPPENCPFEKWICLFGPCSDQLRCYDFKTLQTLRESCGHKDNLPSDYFDRYQELWGDKVRSQSNPKRKSSTSPLAPLVLFPVQALPQECKIDIISKYPIVKDIINELFVCCDHFTAVKVNGKVVSLPAPLRSSTIHNYSIEYLCAELEKGDVILNTGKNGILVLPLLQSLVKIVHQSPPITLPGPVNFEAIESSELLRQFCEAMMMPNENLLGFQYPKGLNSADNEIDLDKLIE